jgi:hypothetical protein
VSDSTAVILGAGPSGLIAAQACVRAGVRPENLTVLTKFEKHWLSAEERTIFRPRKSHLFGAQYLQGQVPGVVNKPDAKISVEFRGTVDGYREKVYGPDYVGRPFPAEFWDPHPAWDIRAVYDRLWNKFEECIIPVEPFNRTDFGDFYDSFLKDFDVVISTIPRKTICTDPAHEFRSQVVYAIGDAPSLSRKCPIPCPPNTVIYNGSPEGSWYRVCNVFGHTTAEWSPQSLRQSTRPPYAGVAEVEKPLSTNCTCWPGVAQLGRYGKWDKHVLAHHVFDDATQLASRAVNLGTQSSLF